MKPNKRLMKKIMKKNLTLNSCVNLEGNNGGDILQIIDNQDGTIHLRIGSCCVMLIDKIVPVESLTGLIQSDTIYILPKQNKPIKIIYDDNRYTFKEKEGLEFEIIDTKPDAEQLFSDLGINIKDKQGNCRPIHDILEEMAKRWEVVKK